MSKTKETPIYSPGLQTWFDAHPRFVRNEADADQEERWESALANGVVCLSDVAYAPRGLRWASGTVWAQIVDFDPMTPEAWLAIAQQFGTKKHFGLHTLWHAVAERKGWTFTELAETAAAWSHNHMQGITQEGENRLQVQVDEWLDFLSCCAQQHPTFEVQSAYLLAQSVFARRIAITYGESDRHRLRAQLDNRVKDWWYSLPPARQAELRAWCDQQQVCPAPTVQRNWLKETPGDTTRFTLYLQTCSTWWTLDNAKASTTAETQMLALSKLRRLVAGLLIRADKEVWLPYLDKWFSPKVCTLLWQEFPEQTKTKGITLPPRMRVYVRMLNETGLLNMDLGGGETLQRRFLQARKSLAPGSRTAENVEWLDPALGDAWKQAWWPEFLKDQKTGVSYMQVVLDGVDQGLPLEKPEQIKIWLRFALSKPSTAFHQFLAQRFTVSTDTDWPHAMDAWLAHWFPGQAPLLTPALGLGLNDDKNQMQAFLRSALEGHGSVVSVDLPNDLDSIV